MKAASVETNLVCLKTARGYVRGSFYFMQLSEAIMQFKGWKSLNVKSSTIHGYDQILRQFCVFMRNCDIEAVGDADVVEWFNLMKMLGYDTNSFIPRAIALRKLFEYYQHKGLQVLDPWLIPVPEMEYKQARVITEEEYTKLLAIIPNNQDPRHIRNRAFINLLWDTGARNGELLSLNMSDLNFEERTAVIKTEKIKGTHPFRRIMWTDSTNKNLQAWIEKREYLKNIFTFHDTDALFISLMGGNVATGKSKQGCRLTIRGTGEMMRHYSVKAQIPHANPHSFRHHKGHDMSHRGANNSVISNLLGHRSLQSSYRYTQLSGNELINIGRKYLSEEVKTQKIYSPLEYQAMESELKRLRILAQRVRVR